MSEDKLKALMARARLEAPPSPDVSGRVLARVRAQEASAATSLAPLAWLALAALAAAIPAAVALAGAWALLTDPLLGLASGLAWWAL